MKHCHEEEGSESMFWRLGQPEELLDRGREEIKKSVKQKKKKWEELSLIPRICWETGEYIGLPNYGMII